MRAQLRPAFVLLALFSLLTGLAYPGLVTLLAQTVFPYQANGSRLEHETKVLGSALIGQSFHDVRYFWGRPSATSPAPYDGRASAGSNLGPTNPALSSAIAKRVATLRAAGPGPRHELVPVDLVTASASGLDPHISKAAALYQVERIAKARGLTSDRLRRLVEAHVDERSFGVFGEPRVNVLLLNLALDG